jgi:hypothetical protein
MACHGARARQKVAPRHAHPGTDSHNPGRVICESATVTERQGCAWLRCRREERRYWAVLRGVAF